MKNMIWLPALTLPLLFSCGGKSGNQVNNDPPADTTQRYVSFADTDTFLNGWSTDNAVIMHWLGEPATLHPTNENNANRHFLAQYMHATLLALNLETLELEPDVAAALPEVSTDGLTYTYTIRKEATWDDNSPVTAEDVIFTYKANKCPFVKNPFAKPYVDQVKDVRKDPSDDHKVQLIMSEKYVLNDYITVDFALLQRKFYDPGNILSNYSFEQMADSLFLVNPPQDVTDWANAFNSEKYGSEVANFNGLGPYKVETWDRGQTLVLVKKQNHWTSKLSSPIRKQLALPEKIYFKTIQDDNALQLELKKQGVDATIFLSTNGLIELQKDEDFNKNYHSGFVPFFNLAVLNMNNKPDGVNHQKLFTDKNVRRAMALLTPVDDMIEVVYFGKAGRLTGPCSPLKKEYNTDLQPIAYNIEEAKKLLKEAGWADTDGDNILDKMIDGKKVKFEFELYYMSAAPITKDMSDMIAESMIQAGVKVNPTGLDIGTLIGKASSHDFDMVFTSFTLSAAPDDQKQLWHTSSWAENGSNFSGFGNAGSDALIDSMRVELDEKKRIAMSKRFQKMVYDDQPVVFLMNTSRKITIHKRFGNAAAFYEKPGVSLNSLRLLYGSIIQQNTTAN